MNLRDVVCDPERLGRYVLFRPAPRGGAAGAPEAARELCAVNNSLVPDITAVVQKQLDVAAILELVRRANRF